MSEKKNWGHTVLGWFVVKEGGEESPAPLEPEAFPADAGSAPQSPEPPPVTFVREPPKAVGGSVDFDGVLRGPTRP
jgi:hypothetical protein